MATSFAAIFNSVGMPILSRSYNCNVPPLPILGLFSAARTSSEETKVPINRMSTQDFEINFKIFENGRVLVVMGKSSSLVKQCKNDKTESILHYMFETVVLFAGMTNVLQSATVDRISRHLKPGLPIIDQFLPENPPLEIISDCNEVFMADPSDPKEQSIAAALRSFGEATNSPLCCIYINKSLAIPTSHWVTQLHPREVALLTFYVRSLHVNPQAQSGVEQTIYFPYFLPSANVAPGTVALRFIVISLSHDIDVCLLCGQEPSLLNVQQNIVPRSFGGILSQLNSEGRYFGNEFSFPVDNCIFGFIFLNRLKNCGVSCYNSNSKQKISSMTSIITGTISYARCKSLLFEFYHTTNLQMPAGVDKNASYMHLHDCILCHVKNGQHEIFVSLGKNVPYYAVIGLAEKTLQRIAEYPLLNCIDY